MKIIFLISLFLFTVQPFLPAFPQAGVADQKEPAHNKTILILNSYHPETKWSAQIANQLESALKKQFPGTLIYNGNLNIEEAQTLGTTLLSMRAIIWQMAERQGDTINPENQKRNSLYRIKKIPDLIVCIGEEAYFEHISLHLWQGKWSEIPLICCSMNDSITSTIWHPGAPLKITALHAMSENKGQRISFIPRNEKDKLEFATLMADIGLNLDDKAEQTPNGDIQYTTIYHTTGVLVEPPVRENLELLKQLMPDLQELVWVDHNYYKSAYALYRLRKELPQIMPGVKLSVLNNNRINTDSIFDVMLQAVPHRAFITYAWNLNGVYSRRPEYQIDSLFSHILSAPILSLSERDMNKSYWLGGVHTPTEAIVSPTLHQITQIVGGTAVDSIPYVQARHTEIHLNMPALKRFGLEKRAREIQHVIYKNIPPSFYKQHEKTILLSIIISIILSGSIILVIKHLLYTRKMKKEYENYHKLYKRLQTIYQNANLDFALYDQNGKLISRVIDGKENNFLENSSHILSDHLFTNPYLNEAHIHSLHQYETVNEEIETENPSKLLPGTKEKNKWNVIIKPLNKTVEQNVCYIAIAIDLTPLVRERKAKERTEHIFRFASETAGIGVASYNLLTGKGFASPSWYTNLNEKPEKNILPTYQNVDAQDRQSIFDYLQRIRQVYVPSPFNRIIRTTDEQGKNHYIQEYIFVRKYAPEQQIIWVVELNINYDEPKRKAKELQEAKEKAEQSNLETEQFLANISHEIRTPLNAIVGFSSILANSIDEDEIQSLAPIIEQNNKLLLTLIDNILYLSKLDSGTLAFTYTYVDPDSLFDSFLKYAREQLAAKQVSVIKEIPTTDEPLYIAETQFRLVMTNLLSNAVKFTTEGQITIGYEERPNENYYFVKDTGCGIHIVDQETIFKRFNKLDVFTQGTGLGLALCRSIIVHQQGEIGVSSTPGKGSTFWFTLPRNPQPVS